MARNDAAARGSAPVRADLPHQLLLRKLRLQFQKDMVKLLVWLQFQVKDPRKTGNLLRMHISGFLIIARDMFIISCAWAICVVLWLRKRTVFGQTRDWRSFWLTTTCKSLRIVLHVPWVWWLVRISLLVKSFALHVRNQVLATGLEKRFQCKCTHDHAPLNQVNYSMTERYSYKFARFYCRAIALRWIDQQEETSWFC